MKKFSKFIACLSAFAMCISTLDFLGINAFADKNAKEPVALVQIYTVVAKPGEDVNVDVVISGNNIENAYCNTSMEINYESPLSLRKVETGYDIEALSSNVEYNNGKNSVLLTTEGESNTGKEGIMYTMTFVVPEDMPSGLYPIRFESISFTNNEGDEVEVMGLDGSIIVEYDFTTTYYPTTTYTTMPTTTTNTTKSTYYTTTSTTTTTTTTTILTDIDTTATTTTPTSTNTSTTATTTVPVVTGTGYENWTAFEDTIISIEDNKVTFAERGKTAVMNNGSNMDMIKNAGVGSKVAVEAIVSPSGSILNIINIEVLEKPDVPTGDANGDDKISVADAVLIMQALANPEEFSITKECAEAADVVNKGDGITSMDALAIQMIDINLLSIEDLPITSEELQEIME
ncbi:MAG: hypothetical protein K2K89_05075 [Ruminococcus sp.]|nr:hypothetical protein [Ruminococcus sp.]